MKVPKYDIRWQFFRNSLKGKKESQKREMIKSFLVEASPEDKERLINYVRGCFYPAPLLDFYMGLIRKTPKELNAPLKALGDYSEEERLSLYKDLFTRNKKWLMKGYFNKDLNFFIDELSASLPLNSRKTEELCALRLNSSCIKNTWRFIY